MNWLHKNIEISKIEDLPQDTYGFIYEVEHLPTGKKYIGKKVLYFERNVKLGKKRLEELKQERKEKGIGGRVPTKEKVTKESDWKTYVGSQKEIKELVKQGNGLKDFKRTILKCVKTKKLLTYYELYYLYKHQVLLNDNYLNDNISGRFFRKDFQEDI